MKRGLGSARAAGRQGAALAAAAPSVALRSPQLASTSGRQPGGRSADAAAFIADAAWLHLSGGGVLRRRALPGGSSGGDRRRCVATAATAAVPGGASPPPPAAGDVQRLKNSLLRSITAANSAGAGKADAAAVIVAAAVLAAAAPSPDAADSPLIEGTWVLLYTVNPARLAAPGEEVRAAGSALGAAFAQRPAAPSPLQAASDAAYNVFYRFAPILAGSAVGARSAGLLPRAPPPEEAGDAVGAAVASAVGGAGASGAFRTRGNFQTFDLAAGFVRNEARFTAFGAPGAITVDGDAGRVAGAPARLRATFKSFVLSWGGGGGAGAAAAAPPPRLSLPLAWLSPVGFVETLFLDETLRVSVGDKGSLFIAAKQRQ